MGMPGKSGMYTYLAAEIKGDEAAKNAAVNADGKILIAVFGCVLCLRRRFRIVVLSLSLSLSLFIPSCLHPSLSPDQTHSPMLKALEELMRTNETFDMTVV